MHLNQAEKCIMYLFSNQQKGTSYGYVRLWVPPRGVPPLMVTLLRVCTLMGMYSYGYTFYVKCIRI